MLCSPRKKVHNQCPANVTDLAGRTADEESLSPSTAGLKVPGPPLHCTQAEELPAALSHFALLLLHTLCTLMNLI